MMNADTALKVEHISTKFYATMVHGQDAGEMIDALVSHSIDYLEEPTMEDRDIIITIIEALDELQDDTLISFVKKLVITIREAVYQ